MELKVHCSQWLEVFGVGGGIGSGVSWRRYILFVLFVPILINLLFVYLKLCVSVFYTTLTESWDRFHKKLLFVLSSLRLKIKLWWKIILVQKVRTKYEIYCVQNDIQIYWLMAQLSKIFGDYKLVNFISCGVQRCIKVVDLK